jgi:hypothetical protein
LVDYFIFDRSLLFVLITFSSIGVAALFVEEIDTLQREWTSGLEQAWHVASQTIQNQITGGDGAMDTIENRDYVIKRLPYLKPSVGSDEIEILVKPQWKDKDIDGKEIEVPERLYTIPVNVSFDGLARALGNLFARLVRIQIESPNVPELIVMQNEEQFQQLMMSLVSESNKSNSQIGSPAKITFAGSKPAARLRYSLSY